MNARQKPTCASLPRSLPVVFAAALTLALGVIPVAAHAANACITKGFVGDVSDGLETPGTGEPDPISRVGTGGTGRVGTGGTGRVGTGGTGRVGTGGTSRVGVVGTITGFASICINDLEVHYSSTTQVVNNGLPGSTADLAVGQVVSIESQADGGQTGELSGGRVSILNAVAGPVSSIDASANSLVVLGQTVRVTAQTLIADTTGMKNFDFLQTGALVRVSGLRLANGDIVASRIETALSLDQAAVLGPVTQSDVDGFSIYGLRVNYSDITGASPVTSGEVMVSGRLDGATLRPERIALGPSLGFTQDIDQLVLEGYIGNRSDSAITVNGVSVALSALSGTSAADLQINQRVQIVGTLLPDHSIVASSILQRRDPMAPPPAASIFPPSKSKALAFNKPGDTKVFETSTAIVPAGPTGTTGTSGSTGATTTGSSGSTSGSTSGNGSGLSGGGSGSGVGGGGIITPGGNTGTTTKPSTPVVHPGLPPRIFQFDSLEFKFPGMPRRVAH